MATSSRLTAVSEKPAGSSAFIDCLGGSSGKLIGIRPHVPVSPHADGGRKSGRRLMMQVSPSQKAGVLIGMAMRDRSVVRGE